VVAEAWTEPLEVSRVTWASATSAEEGSSTVPERVWLGGVGCGVWARSVLGRLIRKRKRIA
jgi:hypothetical protein